MSTLVHDLSQLAHESKRPIKEVHILLDAADAIESHGAIRTLFVPGLLLVFTLGLGVGMLLDVNDWSPTGPRGGIVTLGLFACAGICGWALYGLMRHRQRNATGQWEW